MDSKTLSEDAFKDYLLFNSDATESGSYSANDVSKLYNVTSNEYELKYDLANYQVLKRQILEYEKYRAPMGVATDLLDVDEIIKKLKKNIEKAIPGLKNMLKICDSIADIAEAIKSLYCLFKDVQQLQLTINSGGEQDLGDAVNNYIGEGWEAVEGLFGGDQWPSHDPSYIEAYNALKDAVNVKVNYMKTTPAPPNPGPKPTENTGSLGASYQSAKTAYETADCVLKILEAVEELGYCNASEIAKPTNKISDLSGKGITSEQLKKLNLTENNTRKELFNAINSQLATILGSSSQFSTYKKSELKTAISSMKSKVDSLKSDMDQKSSASSASNAKLAAWNTKNKAYNDYNDKISSYNDAIEEKRIALIDVVGVVSGELSGYKGSFTKLTSSLDKAIDAVETIKEANSATHAENKDTEPDVFTLIKSELILVEESKADVGIAFLSKQKAALEALKAEDVTDSYSFSSHFSTGDLLGESSYYMSKKQVTLFCVEVAGFDVLQKVDQLLDIFKAMWKLVKVLQPFPNTYNWDCVVNLNQSTTNILPSLINGGAGTSENPNTEDIDAISAMLDEARNMLNGGYDKDINAVDPNIRLAESELSAELTERIGRLSTNLTKLTTSSATGGLIGATSILFVSMVFDLLTLVPTLSQIIEDLIFVAQHIEEAIDIIVSSLGENYLLNQYVIDKFPNRTTDTNGDKHNGEISGYSGDTRNFFPDNTKAIQTFSGAQVEYVINGSYNEIENQQHCFWSIFVIRALNNIVGVLTDDTAMELIGACNIAAPLVFILWVYLESNIDMNMLIVDMEVPLIKYQIVLSPNTLMSNVNSICEIFDDVDESKPEDQELSYAAMKVDLVTEKMFHTDGLFKMKYKNYLWLFLFFCPNQQKTMRAADLIQMEMRFKKNPKNGSTDFELQNLYTYTRCEATANFNSILPVLSLSNDSLNGRGFSIDCTKYVGY